MNALLATAVPNISPFLIEEKSSQKDQIYIKANDLNSMRIFGGKVEAHSEQPTTIGEYCYFQRFSQYLHNEERAVFFRHITFISHHTRKLLVNSFYKGFQTG